MLTHCALNIQGVTLKENINLSKQFLGESLTENLCLQVLKMCLYQENEQVIGVNIPEEIMFGQFLLLPPVSSFNLFPSAAHPLASSMKAVLSFKESIIHIPA